MSFILWSPNLRPNFRLTQQTNKILKAQGILFSVGFWNFYVEALTLMKNLRHLMNLK